jgi:proteasome accessory factor A
MPTDRPVPKICGADIELGNFVLGEPSDRSGAEASQILLAEIRRLVRTVPDARGRWRGPRETRDPQDWARSHLTSCGGCTYIDLDHLELCLPEVRSAWDHVAAWHAMLRLTQAALAAANAGREEGQRVVALVNNGDGLNSWGSHLNFLMSRRAWTELMHRKPHYLAWLASFQISAIVYTGQGRVGNNDDDPAAPFQISQRADFLETLAAPQTTFRRPVVNTRDEPLCGGGAWSRDGGREDALDLARLHVIFFDSALAQVPCLLRVGVMQIALAMLERGLVRADLALDDPLAAVRLYSRDPGLDARAPLVSGQEVTAVELQRCFLYDAERFVADGGCEGVVPRAAEIVAVWRETLDLLERRDWPALARRLDWVLKLSLLERVLRQRPELDWSAPDLRHLDQLYGSLDPQTGLFWSFAERGVVDRVVNEAEIERLTREPPHDTRAWGRTMLLRAAGDAVEGVDWDTLRFATPGEDGWTESWRLDLGSPLDATRELMGPSLAGAPTLRQTLRALGAERVRPQVRGWWSSDQSESQATQRPNVLSASGWRWS